MGKRRRGARLPQWLRGEQGSFTLESTIVFPMLFGLILLFILFGMYMYQKVVLYYTASATAERAAFSWDNSFRQAKSGMLNDAAYDGLYWRIGEDELLSGLFGTSRNRASAEAAIPPAMPGEAAKEDLSVRKMAQAAEWIGQADLAYEGHISYSRNALKREITVRLKSPLASGLADQSGLVREPKTVSTASIVDPAEFIRSIDLVRYYSAKYANRPGGAGQANQQAGQALASYKEAAEAQKPQ